MSILCYEQRDLSGILGKMKICVNDDAVAFPKTLIFCKHKRTVCDVLFHLRRAVKSSEFVTMYHASLSEETKQHVFSVFSSAHSQLRCLVSTIAFGMVGFLHSFVIDASVLSFRGWIFQISN